MRISNPQTSSGGLPLATTWYVNKRYADAKLYTDTKVSAAIVDLTAQDKDIVTAMGRYFTGHGETPVFVQNIIDTLSSIQRPALNGYAYLGSDGKVDPSLMPELAIMEVAVAEASGIYDYLKTKTDLFDHTKEFYKKLQENPDDRDTVLAAIKRCLSDYTVLVIEPEKKKEGKEIGKGDILAVTYFDSELINKILADNNEALRNVFAQNYIAGAWIAVDETRGTDKSITALSFTKISYSQGEVLSVNKQIPSAGNGDVSLNLAQIYKYVSGAAGNLPIGTTLATNIQYITTVKDDSHQQTIISGLNIDKGYVPVINFDGRFVFDIIGGCHAYATLEEFVSLNNAVSTTVIALSTLLDKHTAEITELSTNLNTVSSNLNTVVTNTNTNFTVLTNAISATVDVLEILSGQLPVGTQKRTFEQAYPETYAEIMASGSLYEGSVFNYFGIQPNSSYVSAAIAVIDVPVPGYVASTYGDFDNTFKEIPTDITLNSDKTSTVRFFSEYDANNGIEIADVGHVKIYYRNEFNFVPSAVL